MAKQGFDHETRRTDYSSAELVIMRSDHPSVRERVEAAMVPHGFVHRLEENGERRVNWAEKEQDLAAWKPAFEIIFETCLSTDEEFRSTIIPTLKAVMANSPTFNKLSLMKASASANTAEHVFDGLLKLATAGLKPWQVIGARFGHLLHDIGKIFRYPVGSFESGKMIDKTDKDFDTIHGLFSSELAREFFKFLNPDNNQELARIGNMVEDLDHLHHLGELIYEKRIDGDEFKRVYKVRGAYSLDELMSVLAAITAADTGSVPKYDGIISYNVGELINVVLAYIENFENMSEIVISDLQASLEHFLVLLSSIRSSITQNTEAQFLKINEYVNGITLLLDSINQYFSQKVERGPSTGLQLASA